MPARRLTGSARRGCHARRSRRSTLRHGPRAAGDEGGRSAAGSCQFSSPGAGCGHPPSCTTTEREAGSERVVWGPGFGKVWSRRWRRKKIAKVAAPAAAPLARSDDSYLQLRCCILQCACACALSWRQLQCRLVQIATSLGERPRRVDLACSAQAAQLRAMGAAQALRSWRPRMPGRCQWPPGVARVESSPGLAPVLESSPRMPGVARVPMAW